MNRFFCWCCCCFCIVSIHTVNLLMVDARYMVDTMLQSIHCVISHASRQYMYTWFALDKKFFHVFDMFFKHLCFGIDIFCRKNSIKVYTYQTGEKRILNCTQSKDRRKRKRKRESGKTIAICGAIECRKTDFFLFGHIPK